MESIHALRSLQRCTVFNLSSFLEFLGDIGIGWKSLMQDEYMDIVVDPATNTHVYAMSKQPFQLRTMIPESTNSVRGNP